MTFVYKIWAKYDGFTPARVGDRMASNGLLRLRWTRYLDEVEIDDLVWIHFRGHRGPPSIYARGLVDRVDADDAAVWLRVLEHGTEPLVDGEIGEQIERLVAVTRLQVFAIEPEEFGLTPPDIDCDRVGGPATTCSRRRCDECPMWQRLPAIERDDLNLPTRLRRSHVAAFVPGIWVRPKRQPRYPSHRLIPEVREATTMFHRFKTGEQNMAYPLSLAAYKALRRRGLLSTDAIIPIPLSPDKAQAGEIDRCDLLAEELSRLIGAPVCTALSLSSPISKRRMGVDPPTFERAYRERLDVDASHLPDPTHRLLLVDDVATRGSTLRVAAAALRRVLPRAEIVAVTGAQMILRDVLRREELLLRSP